MDPSLLGQVLLNAAMLGGLYSLLAIGLSLIYSIMKIIHFSHGSTYMLGGFVFYFIFMAWSPFNITWLDVILGVILTSVAIAAYGAIVEPLIFRPLRNQDLNSMIVGLGLALLIEGSTLLAWGETPKYIRNFIPGVLEFGGITVTYMRIVALGTSMILILALFSFLARNKWGRAMRAMSQDEEAAALQGIETGRMSLIGFIIGSVLAAIAAVLMVPITYVDPWLGGSMTIKAWTIIILGGIGSIPGAVVGAFALGLIESFSWTFISQAGSLLSFGLVVTILIVRPKGLIGRE